MASRPPTILFVCAEDWFFHSHFRPLVSAARRADARARIVLLTNVNDKRAALEELGVEVIPFGFRRGSLQPFAVWRAARRLRRVVRRLRPDLVHCIALTPILLAVLARIGGPAIIFHVTGLGTLAEGDTPRVRLLRSVLLRLLGWHVRRHGDSLLLENPDDAGYLQEYGLPRDADITIVGGAGLDPARFPPLPDPGGAPLRLAFVGRLIATKGVDVLIAAMDAPPLREMDLRLDLFGAIDAGNAGAYAEERVRAWAARDDVSWHGFIEDVRDVWRRAAICVLPTRTREGMPRALLEAAACARPLVVTDVPGCRHFVRDGVEGFVVPPENPRALAAAIARLAADPALRVKMGRAARRRLLEGFTEQRVVATIGAIHRRLLRA
ncbi:MAG TPA: glycosyltransferase family 1 protein [Thermopetrobacter sp.]|nr:glycosyltransferase family 1 protein [Thermopetrobacter sp.]